MPRKDDDSRIGEMGTIPQPIITLAQQERGQWEPRHLESVRDQLKVLRSEFDPKDYERPLSQFHFEVNGQYKLALMGPTGREQDMTFSPLGLRQFASVVLPSRGLGFIEQLSKLTSPDPKQPALAKQMAAATVNLFLRQQREARLIRTLKLGDQRCVRAVLSDDYTPIDDVEILDMLLTLPEYQNLPVIKSQVGPTCSRFQFAVGHPEDDSVHLAELGNTNRGVLVRVPMIEISTSEVGTRSVRVDAGMYRSRCTNIVSGTWDDALSYRFNHIGSKERILRGLKEAFASTMTQISGVVQAYTEALSIQINDVFGFVQAALAEQFTEAQLDAVHDALLDETTSRAPDGMPKALSSVVDAITLAAQEHDDPSDQYDMQSVAMGVLRSGVHAAGESRAIHVQRERGSDHAMILNWN